jgi:hypothetical protein
MNPWITWLGLSLYAIGIIVAASAILDLIESWRQK